MRPTGHDHARAAFGKPGQGGHDASEQGKNYPVGLTENYNVARLGDVLGGGSPMNPASVRFTDHATKFDDQWH